MSSAKRKAPRRLERFRARLQTKTIAEKQGLGKSVARTASAVAMRESIARKKVSGKLVRDIEGLGVSELQQKLAEARRELLDLRFKHATAQLAEVASIPATKRRIARILTVIKQKEVGA